MNQAYLHLENLSLDDLDYALAEFKTVLELTAVNSDIYLARVQLLERRELEVKYFKEKWFDLYNQRNFLFAMRVELVMLHESIIDAKNLLDALNQLETNLNNPFFNGLHPFALDFKNAIYSYHHTAMKIAYNFFNKYTADKTLPGGIYEKKLLTQMTLSVNEIYKHPFDINARQQFFWACNQFPRHNPDGDEALEPVGKVVSTCLFLFTLVILTVSLVTAIPAYLAAAALITFMLGLIVPPILTCPVQHQSETRLRHEGGLHDTLLDTAYAYKRVSPLRQHSIMRMPSPLSSAPPPAYEELQRLAI